MRRTEPNPDPSRNIGMLEVNYDSGMARQTWAEVESLRSVGIIICWPHARLVNKE